MTADEAERFRENLLNQFESETGERIWHGSGGANECYHPDEYYEAFFKWLYEKIQNERKGGYVKEFFQDILAGN